jgi:hypothetical protein
MDLRNRIFAILAVKQISAKRTGLHRMLTRHQNSKMTAECLKNRWRMNLIVEVWKQPA